MWRFLAVLVLAFVGMAWFVFFADFVQRTACVTAFGAAMILPLVLNPTRHWARGFFLCFDMVYAASCIGAYVATYVDLAPLGDVFLAALVPALLCGPMASLGVGRSGLADIELEKPRREIDED